MTSDRKPRFTVGDKVQYRTDRAKVGEVVKEPVDAQGFYFYDIRLFTGGREAVPEEDLENFHSSQDPRGLFGQGRFGGPDDLVRKATYHKLNQPLQNTLYSLGASRTEFYPHQFKPLLKFIDSEDHRLLIADEVGLGKTIEAGLILVELRARRQLAQVLVTCPAALVHKWRHEMWSRFDEEFRVMRSSDLRELMRTYHDRGDVGELKAIISLQSLRQRGNRDLLEATPLPIDLLIVDEAHHLRNPGTLSHRTVDALAVGASAILFLTATPIHLGSENLFHLLRILSPGEFNDVRTFDERLSANEPIVEAERLARNTPLPKEEILERLGRARGGAHREYFEDNPFHRRSTELLEQSADLEQSDRIELESNLKDLNLFSHIITRTRKRDAFEDSAVRTARVVAREPAVEEQAFYEAVTAFVRDLHGEGTGSHFAAITAQRQVASCMQAAQETFRQRALRSLGDPDPEDSDLDLDTWTEGLRETEDNLTFPQRLLVAADGLGDTDTKFEALLEQLRALEEEEPGRKLIVFSYFKPTLRYLERRLTEEGLACVRIDGDVPSNPTDPDKDERGRIMRAFKEEPAIQILLSSEVGSEGLDFQFCHVLVNYDLPWNPMRVEQRIGRVDRLGQESDRIIVVNLSLAGTIEHRILNRLYQRIGIFRQSIGDMEAILGEEIEKLTRDLLSRHLTPEEEDRRIEQTAVVLEKRKQELEKLEKEGDRFVGRDFYFDEQLERARTGGEILAGHDLRLFLEQFLERMYPHVIIRSTRDERIISIDVDESLESDLRRMRDPRPIHVRFLHRITRGGGKVRSTFDSRAAFADNELEFLAPHHPLMALAVEHYQRHPEELHPTAALSIKTGLLEPGQYVYLLNQITSQVGAGPHKTQRHRLEPFIASAKTGTPIDRHLASLTFGVMLRDGQPHEVSHWDTDAAEELTEELDVAFIRQLAEDRQQLRQRQAARVKTRVVTLESSFNRKVERKRELLADARREDKPANYIRLLEGTIRNLQAEFTQRREELEAERDIQVTSALVASGILVVEE